MSTAGRRSRAARLAAAFASSVLAFGCSARSYERDADRAVEAVLSPRTAHTLGAREEAAVRPAQRAAPTPDAGASAVASLDAESQRDESQRDESQPGESQPGESQPGGPPPATTDEAPTRVLGLRDALAIAVRSNREYRAEQESLYLSALALTGAQYDFSPRVAAALAYMLSDGDGVPKVGTTAFVGSVAQALPWGGSVSVAGTTSLNDAGSDTYGSSLGLQLVQPLLRGAGHEVAWESLRQAERNVVYAIRDFELFRESFSIDVASRYYDLVQQQQALENQRRNLEGFSFGYKQATALYSVGRTSELEVLRARRSELTSQNSLIEARESYRAALDEFRIFLGLPEAERIDVQGEAPPFVAVTYDVASAVDAALHNRLDWRNREQQLEDTQRAVRIARNGLLPDLGLTFGYTLASNGAADFAEQHLDDDSYSVGLSLSLPVQRVKERNAYRSAQIAAAQGERGLSKFKEELIVAVQSRFRELERRSQSLEIQTQLIADQRRNVKIAQLRFEQGNFSNRDVVEAQQALLDAQNALISEQVGYELARLRLLKGLGILFVDEKGMWKE